MRKLWQVSVAMKDRPDLEPFVFKNVRAETQEEAEQMVREFTAVTITATLKEGQ